MVIKCKTVFKKKVVERALRKEEERDTDDDQSEDPTIKYFLKYSVDNQTLLVGNVEVIVDETEKCLRCSQCLYANKNKWNERTSGKELGKMEFGIRNHIIGQHLGGFRCKQCEPVRVVHQSLSAHQKHIIEKHNEKRRKLDAKVKASHKINMNGEAVTSDEDSSSSDDEFWPNGERKMKRYWKCGYDNCGKKFHKETRWIRHEKNVHGEVKGKN